MDTHGEKGTPQQSHHRSPPHASTTTKVRSGSTPAKEHRKYLVVGDGVMAPYTALSLRLHGLSCDILLVSNSGSAHSPGLDGRDRGSLVLTPNITSVLGDTMGIAVPTGSAVDRFISFDHVGNDMCDLNLDEMRGLDEGPTFFSCDRTRLQQALLNLCRTSRFACTVFPVGSAIEPKTLIRLPNGHLRLRIMNDVTGGHREYTKVIVTSRAVTTCLPPLQYEKSEAVSNKSLWGQQVVQNHQEYEAAGLGERWFEVMVPSLPPLKPNEKRFTPGSQELIELITPSGQKMLVRPYLNGNKLNYNVILTIPSRVADPTKPGAYDATYFWSHFMEAWTNGIPGYVSHTLFRPMIEHMQRYALQRNIHVYRTRRFALPWWSEASGSILRIGHAAYDTHIDSIDVSDALAFSDAVLLSQKLAYDPEAAATWLQDTRRTEVATILSQHGNLLRYSLKERGQLSYAASRFTMKFLRRYKSGWRGVLGGICTPLSL